MLLVAKMRRLPGKVTSAPPGTIICPDGERLVEEYGDGKIELPILRLAERDRQNEPASVLQ